MISSRVAMLSMHTSPLDQPGRTRDAGGMNVYIRELARELSSYHRYIDIFTRQTDLTDADHCPIGAQCTRNPSTSRADCAPP